MRRTLRTRPRPADAWATVAGALLLLGGCATRAPLLPPLVVQPSADAELLSQVAELQAEGARRGSVRAVARVRIEGPGGSGTVREIILARRPASLRLEGLNFLGQTQSLLVTDGQRFLFFDGQEFEQGPVNPDTLMRTLGLDLAPAEAVEALLVAPLDGSEPPPAPREVWARGEERWLSYPVRRLRLGPGGELRGIQAIDPLGGVRWEAEYAEWRPLGGSRYPFAITLSFPGSQVRAEVDFEEVELNPPLEARLFRPVLGEARR